MGSPRDTAQDLPVPPPPLNRALAAGRLVAQSVGLRLAAAVIVVAALIALVAFSHLKTAAQTDERMGGVDDPGEIEGESDEGGDGPVDSTPTQTCVEGGENLGTLARGVTVERSGELSDGDCLARVRSDENQWVDRFVFTLSEPETVRVELLYDSESFDPATDTGRQPQPLDAYLVLNRDGSQVASNDDGGAGTNSLISRALDAGTYEIVATSYSVSKAPTRHLYRLTVERESCELAPLGVLADISATTLSRTGSFATSGCTVETGYQSSNPGAVYTFELAEPRSVQIDLQGLDGANSYLGLRAEGNSWRTAVDDDSGPGRDARIRYNLRAGEYRIEAGYVGDTEEAGAGRYRLTLTVDAAPACEEDQLGLAHGMIERSGEFGAGGCITDQWGSSWYWSAVHVFSLAESGRIQIDLDGIDGVDPTLWLTDEQDRRIASDEDGGAGRGARIERELDAGTYRINAQRSWRSDGQQDEPGGRYRLTIDATSQSVPISLDAGRIVVRRLANGRTEFGWQPKDATERILPRSRTLGTTAEVGRWLRSSPVEVAGVAIGRIDVRLLADGRVEFGFTTTDGERILPRVRWLPADPPIDRWLRSSEIELSESTE